MTKTMYVTSENTKVGDVVKEQTKRVVEYYEGVRKEANYVAIKGIELDWRKSSYESEVTLYVLRYDNKVAHDWVPSGEEKAVSLGYFLENFKNAGTIYLY